MRHVGDDLCVPAFREVLLLRVALDRGAGGSAGIELDYLLRGCRKAKGDEQRKHAKSGGSHRGQCSRQGSTGSGAGSATRRGFVAFPPYSAMKPRERMADTMPHVTLITVVAGS